MRDLKDFQDIAKERVDDYKDLRLVQQGIDRIAHLDYRLPPALEKLEWVRPFISTAPYEAERAATRALANLMPRLKIEPVSVLKAVKGDYTPDSQAVREIANQWEKALLWQFGLTSGRQGVLLPDIIRSALRYDEICAQVLYLPEQIKSVTASGGNAKRYEAMRRFGEYAVIIRNAKDVYARYSDLMTEEVMFVQKYSPQGLVDFYGQRAEEIQRMIKRDDEQLPESYILFDFVDHEDHCVWAVPGDDVTRAVESGDAERDTGIVEIVREPVSNSILNGWVCKKGGSTLEGESQYQRYPLLWPVYQADQWLNANLMGTLMMSEAVTKAAGPTITVEGPSGSEGVEIDYGDPGQPAIVKPGHKLTQLQREMMDPALREGADRITQAMNDATVARILTTADTVPGESFSGYNLRVNNAVGSLMPWKKLADSFVGEVFTTMLLWCHYTGNTLDGYGKERKDKGRYYEINGEDVEPNKLYLTAELVPDMPTDRQQKVNTAIMMSRDLKYPATRILEELGESDPEGAIKEYYLEQFTFAFVQGKLQLIQAESANAIEQQAAAMAQQMLQEAMEGAQQQQEAMPPEGLEGMPPEMAGAMGGMPPDLMGGMGMEGVGGMGMNPGMGGQPPAMANPPMNGRESQTGLTRAGGPI